MLPNSSVFRSRWTALIWAAGVVLLAVTVAGTGRKDADADAAAQADTSAAMNALDSIN
jgi:hypothetical protein